MTSNISNNNPSNMNLNLNLSLQPPDASGAQYDNIAVRHGRPFGQEDGSNPIARILGFSPNDTIASADQLSELDALVKQFNITLFSNLSPSNLQQQNLNSIDPSQPQLPVIASLMNISNKSVNSLINSIKDSMNNPANAPLPGGGSITNPSDNTTVLDATGTGATTVSVSGGRNPYLAGNAYVTFLITFMELFRLLKENKVVQGQVELNSMNLITSIAKDTADAIMKAAYAEQAMHIAAAVAAGVSLAANIISGIGTIKEAMTTEEAPTKETDEAYRSKQADEKMDDIVAGDQMMKDWKSSLKSNEKDDTGEPIATEQELNKFKNEQIINAKSAKAQQELEAKYTADKDALKEDWEQQKAKKYWLEKNGPQEDAKGNKIYVNTKGHTESEVKVINERSQQRTQFFKIAADVATSAGQTAQHTVEAAEDIPLATQRALQALLEATKTITTHTLQQSSDAFKADTDLIAQLLQTLDQMRDKLTSAVQASLNAAAGK